MIALKNLIQDRGFDFKVESEGRNLSTFEKIVISVIRAILSVRKNSLEISARKIKLSWLKILMLL